MCLCFVLLRIAGPSVGVVWLGEHLCCALMADPHRDPSQEDYIDPNLLSHGTSLPTQRLSTGPRDSSQFTMQGAPIGAQNQRPAESASNLGPEPRSMISSNQSFQSRIDPISTGSLRGVDTDGSSHPVSLNVPLITPRPPSSGARACP